MLSLNVLNLAAKKPIRKIISAVMNKLITKFYQFIPLFEAYPARRLVTARTNIGTTIHAPQPVLYFFKQTSKKIQPKPVIELTTYIVGLAKTSLKFPVNVSAMTTPEVKSQHNAVRNSTVPIHLYSAYFNFTHSL